MFYQFLYPLRDIWFGFNIFRYITFRAAMASVSAFMLSIVFGPWIIKRLHNLKISEKIRQEDEVHNLYHLHKSKEGTPTMGGIIIIAALIASVVLWQI